MKKPIIVIEGKRNVGKSFLINSVSNLVKSYKLPFKAWFDSVLDSDMNNNIDKRLFYVPFGGEMTILDLYHKGILKDPIILDRSFISNIVFGLQSGRIDKDEALLNIKFLLNKYSHLFTIIYIDSDDMSDDRNKDGWDIYTGDTTKLLYSGILSSLNIGHINFHNHLNKKSVDEFHQLISSLI